MLDGQASGLFHVAVEELVRPSQEFGWIRRRAIGLVEQQSGFRPDDPTCRIIVELIDRLRLEPAIEPLVPKRVIPLGGRHTADITVLAAQGRQQIKQNVTLPCGRQPLQSHPQPAQFPLCQSHRQALGLAQSGHVRSRHRRHSHLRSPACRARYEPGSV